jgi:hypothetical protein
LDLVTNAPEGSAALLPGALYCRRIFQAPVNSLATTEKYRAMVPRVITDGDNVIE